MHTRSPLHYIVLFTLKCSKATLLHSKSSPRLPSKSLYFHSWEQHVLLQSIKISRSLTNLSSTEKGTSCNGRRASTNIISPKPVSISCPVIYIISHYMMIYHSLASRLWFVFIWAGKYICSAVSHPINPKFQKYFNVLNYVPFIMFR